MCIYVLMLLDSEKIFEQKHRHFFANDSPNKKVPCRDLTTKISFLFIDCNQSLHSIILRLRDFQKHSCSTYLAGWKLPVCTASCSLAFSRLFVHQEFHNEE